MLFQRHYHFKSSGGAWAPGPPLQLAPSALVIAPPPPINLTLLRHCSELTTYNETKQTVTKHVMKRQPEKTVRLAHSEKRHPMYSGN